MLNYDLVAIEKSRKQAVTDATKRALKMFGPGMGQCLSDKEYLKFIKPHLGNAKVCIDKHSPNILFHQFIIHTF